MAPTWYRAGSPASFAADDVGWVWEIRRNGSEPRSVQVVFDPDLFTARGVPSVVRHAIRSRGATAIDAFLNEDDPPARIRVSTEGVGREPREPAGDAKS
jgi:hypothetical protein